MTLELGGHAPFIVTNDADVDLAAQMGATLKFRNAGQACAAPTRFYIQSGVYEAFMERFVALTTAITLGDGFGTATRMGPLSRARRVLGRASCRERGGRDATITGDAVSIKK